MANTIKIGSIEADAIKIGTSTVSKVYVGTELVYPTDVPHDYSQDYLTFVAETNGVYVTLASGSSNPYYYSVDDGTTWNSLTTTTTSVNTGGKILLKCIPATVDAEKGIGNLNPSGAAHVEGNILSLVYGDNFTTNTTLTRSQFRRLFKDATNITSAENLVLPSLTLVNMCYSMMFHSCSNLTTAPKEVPATQLDQYCMSDMFNSCTSLTKAPILPTTTYQYCYWFMFQNCTSLETAPDLLATTLTTACYGGTFYGCTNLKYIKCLATSGINSNNLQNWATNVPSGGTFVKAATASWSTGNAGIPSGWTVENA